MLNLRHAEPATTLPFVITSKGAPCSYRLYHAILYREGRFAIRANGMFHLFVLALTVCPFFAASPQQ
jgi:hypothetical protein